MDDEAIEELAGPPGSALGLDAQQLRLYQLLLQRPGVTVSDIAIALTSSRSAALRQLAALEERHFAVQVDDHGEPTWQAQEPADSLDVEFGFEIERLIAMREEHRALRQLSQLYWRHRSGLPYDGVEVIHDHTLLLETLESLQNNAQQQVRAFDRPPYFSLSKPERIASQLRAQLDAMRRGVEYRVIYQPETWEQSSQTNQALSGIADGEQARLLTQLPMKLYLIDDDRAVMPLDPAHHSDTSTLIVHPSGLLRAIAQIFEFYWSQATPISITGAVEQPEEVSERARTILTLLAAGANDETVARRLELSRSTVTRIIADLEQRLGASSRFQLGAQASRRGWI